MKKKKRIDGKLKKKLTVGCKLTNYESCEGKLAKLKLRGELANGHKFKEKLMNTSIPFVSKQFFVFFWVFCFFKYIVILHYGYQMV